MIKVCSFGGWVDLIRNLTVGIFFPPPPRRELPFFLI